MAFVPADQLPVTAQRPGMAMMIAARDAASVERTVRQLFDQKHPGINMQFADFEQGIRDDLVGDRLMAMLSGAFGVLAAIAGRDWTVRSAVVFPGAAERRDRDTDRAGCQPGTRDRRVVAGCVENAGDWSALRE